MLFAPQVLIEGRPPVGAVLAVAELAGDEVHLGREDDARDTLVGNHQEGVGEPDADEGFDVAEEGEQRRLLLDAPRVGVPAPGFMVEDLLSP